MTLYIVRLKGRLTIMHVVNDITYRRLALFLQHLNVAIIHFNRAILNADVIITIVSIVPNNAQRLAAIHIQIHLLTTGQLF